DAPQSLERFYFNKYPISERCGINGAAPPGLYLHALLGGNNTRTVQIKSESRPKFSEHIARFPTPDGESFERDHYFFSKWLYKGTS
ncbi:hypothetical protein, partial [Salmonella sp. gx-f5]|uniref:hypothetical protein n=1 Tax=Salmonella sp. gx-f5 TaxID=2582605 RepID=UPI001F19FED8